AAKFFADHMENVNLGPFEAVRTTGAPRSTAIAYALVPDVLPVFASTSLFWWEFNVRASTVLGVVGAGGIGQELKNSMDLLDFPLRDRAARARPRQGARRGPRREHAARARAAAHRRGVPAVQPGEPAFGVRERACGTPRLGGFVARPRAALRARGPAARPRVP